MIDEWKRTYEGGKYMGLLLRSKPDKDGKVKDWLVAMNNNFENGSAENMRIWIKKELKAIGLSIENVTVVTEDNEATNQALARDMQADFEGCCVHLIDLIMDDSWELLNGSWSNKIQNIINTYLISTTMQLELETRQEVTKMLRLKLVAWNATRWLGKPLALHRLVDVCKDPEARRILKWDLTDAEEQAMMDVLGLMDIVASLTVSFSKEKNIFPIITTCNYGSHYRLIQQTYVSCVLQLATLDWDCRQQTERERTWAFGKKLLDGFEKRFLTSVRPEVIIGYAMDKGKIEEFGFGSVPDLERIFLTQDRDPNKLVASEEMQDYLSVPDATRIFTQASECIGECTPINSANIMCHLKYHFTKLNDRWNKELYTDDSIGSAIESLLEAHPLPPEPTVTPNATHSTTSSSPGAQRLLTGRRSGKTASLEIQLRDEWKHFKCLSLPSGFDNSLQWACDVSTFGYSTFRHIIKIVLPRSFTSVPVEQVFSTCRHQTEAYSSTLNSDDYETRVTVAYNRRNYSFEERAKLYGIAPFVFKYLESKQVKERFSQATGVVVGASARRNPEKAREAKAENRALQRSVSAPPGPVATTTTPGTKRSKSKRPRNSQLPSFNMDGDDELSSENHFISRTQIEKQAQREAAQKEGMNQRICRKLKEILDGYAEDENGLRMAFVQLLNKSLSSMPHAAKLREVVPTIRLDKIVHYVKNLKKDIEEGLEANFTIEHSLTNISSIVEGGSNSSMDVDIPAVHPEINVYLDMPTPLRARNFWEEARAAQADLTDLQAFLLALKLSFEHWKQQNEAYTAELDAILKYLKKRGCVLVNVPSDGNCLYHAICLALRFHGVVGAPENHFMVRAELVEFMDDQDDDWFELGAKETKKQYIEKQRQPGTWGDINTVKAAAMTYRRVFNIVTADQGKRKVDGREGGKGTKPAEIELILVSFRHYMFACPEKQVGRIASAAGASLIVGHDSN